MCTAGWEHWSRMVKEARLLYTRLVQYQWYSLSELHECGGLT